MNRYIQDISRSSAFFSQDVIFSYVIVGFNQFKELLSKSFKVNLSII